MSRRGEQDARDFCPPCGNIAFWRPPIRAKKFIKVEGDDVLAGYRSSRTRASGCWSGESSGADSTTD
jgi:hypothetical protein